MAVTCSWRLYYGGHTLWSFMLFLAWFFGVFWVCFFFTRGLLTSLKHLEITTTAVAFPKAPFN